MARNWYIGDPTPAFTARCTASDNFIYDSVAGRYVVLTFFGSAAIEKNYKAIQHIRSHTEFLNDYRGTFFGVSVDPTDYTAKRLEQSLPGTRYFWDFDYKVSRLYGAMEAGEIVPEQGFSYRSFTLVLDPMLRVMAYIPLKDLEEHNRMFDAVIAGLPPVDGHAGVKMTAPVLILPRVFEPEFCRNLIRLYQENGGEESGFMREVNGKTVGILDNTFKKRKDFQVEDETLKKEIIKRFARRIFPEIKRAYQYEVTRVERYLVACYDSQTGGYFRAHRDNTTKGTAHRRFACTINLNADEFEGGELRFPEFGSQSYRAPTGGAVVFSCSLLHEALPVTKGRRYAFLPFFYDDEGDRIRQQNQAFLQAPPAPAAAG